MCSIWTRFEIARWRHSVSIVSWSSGIVMRYFTRGVWKMLFCIPASTKLKRVFTRTSISTGTVFGPLVGPLVDPEIYQRAYQFGFIQDGKLLVYNLTGDNRSNWMKFVRLSEDPNKVNLMAYQHGLQVYFITLRTILADEELCVGYSYHVSDYQLLQN